MYSNQSDGLADKVVSDYREAQTASSNYSADLQQAEHAKQMASYAENHSQSIQENLSQRVAERITEQYGARAGEILTNTTSEHDSAIRNNVGREIIQEDVARQTHAMNQHLGEFNPQQFFQQGSDQIQKQQETVWTSDQTNQAKVHSAAGQKADYHANEAANVSRNVNHNIDATHSHVAAKKQSVSDRTHYSHASGEQTILVGEKEAKAGIASHALDKVSHPWQSASAAISSLELMLRSWLTWVYNIEQYIHHTA